AVIVETGMATQLGKIAGRVQQETKEETPLQRQLDRLGRQIGVAVLLAAGVIFAIGVIRDPGHIELLFLTAVGLSVAAIPEGLPAIVTISLALGLQRMIRRGALIRKLPAVEALGAASVICSDKTGTLTKGEMNVRAVIAFTSERKKMSSLHAPLSASQIREILALPEGERLRRLEGGAANLHVKGAPERILAACSHHIVDGERKPLSEYDRKQYLFRNQELATRALRVLGFAVREFQGDLPPLKEEVLETDLTFLGLAGMMDAPRSDAIEAIRRCKKAGIRVVMITGDHKLTAMAVAREMGILGEGDRALAGEELEKMSDEELVRGVERIRVYARVAPEHKM